MQQMARKLEVQENNNGRGVEGPRVLRFCRRARRIYGKAEMAVLLVHNLIVCIIRYQKPGQLQLLIIAIHYFASILQSVI